MPDQEDPFKKYGGKQIDEPQDPFKKYGGQAIAEPVKKKGILSGVGGVALQNGSQGGSSLLNGGGGGVSDLAKGAEIPKEEVDKSKLLDYLQSTKTPVTHRNMNGLEAKEMLSVWDKIPHKTGTEKLESITGTGTIDNAVGNKLKKESLETKAKEYDNLAIPLRDNMPDASNVSAYQNPNFTNTEFSKNEIDKATDFFYKDRIYNEAVKWYASKNPQFAKELEATGVEPDKGVMYKIPDVKLGNIVSQYLSQPDLNAFIEKERPDLYPAFESVSRRLVTDNKDYGLNVMANEISQEIQNSGYNNIEPIFNFKKGVKEAGDIIGTGLYQNDPDKIKFYQENKEEILNMLDAPSFFEGFASTIKGAGKGIKNTFTQPFESVSETVKNNWENEINNVTANPKGLTKFIRDVGSGTGFVASIAAPGGILKAAGLSPKAASAVSITTTFFGDQLEQGVLKYPDNPVKAWTSATLNTTLYAALAYDLFPAEKAAKAMQVVKPEVEQVVKNLSSGAITRETARKEMQTITKKAVDAIGGALKTNTKASLEMAAITAVNKKLDKVFMDEDTYNEFHTSDEEAETFKHLFMSNSLVSAMSGYGAMKQRNKLFEESIYNAASNPKQFQREIEKLKISNPEINVKELYENLKFVKDVKDLVDGKDMSEKNKKAYLAEALKAKVARDGMKASPEETVLRKYDEQAKRSDEIKEKLLNGEDADKIVTEAEVEANKEKLKAEADRNKLIEKGQKAIDKLLEEKDENDKNVFTGVYRDVAKKDPEGFLEDISEQAFGTSHDGTPLKGGGREKELVKSYGADIVNTAKELFPKKEIKEEPIPDLNFDSETNQPTSEAKAEAPVSGVEGGDVEISVGEMIDKTGTYKGEKGSFYQDGQTVVFKVEGKNKEYELGNINEIKDTPISDFDITHEESVVSISESGGIKVRDQEYKNNYSNPLAAINKDADGNVVSVNLETADGKKRTFRGNIAEDIAYQINLKEINKNNETRTEFEQHLNEDAAASKEMDNGTVLETPKKEPVKNNEPVSREKVKSKQKPIAKEQSTKVEEQGGGLEAGKSEIVTQNIENQPPEPPKKPPVDAEGGSGGELNDKGVLNRLYNAKGTPQAAKEGFKKEGLKYVPAGREEAAAVAKTVVDEFGIDEAVLLAEANKFKGGVNSAIFAESLNRLYQQEVAAKTPQEKAEIAKKFAEVGIRYDEVSREKGRDISQIDFFYKKSPLGVEMIEKAKRKEAFEEWAKPKDKSWKEVFDEMMKNEEFEKEVNERVKEELKKERAETRKARKEKVDKFFDDAVEKTKGGATYSTVIPPPVIRAAIRGMQKAYHAGEKVVELVEEAVAYISDKLGTDSWDKDRFRKEWTEKLKDKQEKKPLTDAELKTKILDKFRKKLKGLSDAERDEVIRKSFKKIVESGGLDYQDFRDIIGEVTGRKSLTEAEAAKLRELVNITNSVKDAETRVLTERTDEALLAFRKAELQAGKAAKELSELLYNKPDIVKRITSIMQLSTLGIPSLVNNPIYNIWNQATLRFPVGVINDVVDRVIGGMAKLVGKNYVREYNVFETQKEFWNKLGLGTKESMTQLFTGLNRQDYTQKELYGQQIRPFKSMRDLLEWSQGKKKLNQRQIWDKAIQATVGVPAEAVARVLNIGDKPMRFSAEGAQASAFAKALGLKGMDYKLFVEFPREEAYRAYKAQGLSDAEAAQKADYVKEAVVKEGQRSTFQQDNLLNEGITRLFSIFGGKESGAANFTKAITISPYVKIPSNAFWSYYNLLNPEIAILQAMAHGGRAKYFSNKGEFTKSKLAAREARYWMAHAIVGMASRVVVIALVKQGVFTPGSDEDDSKKERDAVSYFDKPGTTQVGDMKISNRWFGQWGMLGNAMAKKYRDATPEQREKQDDFWNTIFGGMEVEGLKEMQNGIFANSSALLQAIDSGNPDRYLTNTLNMMANIVQPASIAQINRASLDEVPSSRGDNLLDKLNQNFAQRSPLYRKLTGTQIDKKRDIWGQTIPRGGNVLSRMFGISKANPQIFARPIYDDYLKTGDSGFLPPAVLPVLDGQKLNTKQYETLQEYIGAERKKLVEPYVNDMAVVPLVNKTYSELGDDKKKEVLTFMYSLGRENGVKRFYKDFPELKPKDKPVDEVVDDRIMEAAKKIIKIKNQ